MRYRPRALSTLHAAESLAKSQQKVEKKSGLASQQETKLRNSTMGKQRRVYGEKDAMNTVFAHKA
jgi:hypothetical protein